MTGTGARRGPGRRSALVVLAVGLVAVAVVAVGIGLTSQPAPGPAKVGEPPQAPLIVSVSHAGDPVANVGFPTQLTVHALGSAPIEGIELWVGARRLAEASNTGGGPAQVARWTWTPAAAGPVILVARATDAGGRQVQSSALRLTVIDEAPIVRPVRQVEVQAGESAEAAARRVGGETADLARWNAGLDPTQPLEAGTVVFVPLAPAEVPRPPASGEITGIGSIEPLPFLGSSARIGNATLASWSGAGPEITIGPPAAGTGLFVPPEVTTEIKDCTIEVAVTGAASNATGLALYGLGPQASGFTRMATFPADGATSTFSAGASPGSYLFSASAFNGAVEQQGDLVAVEVPQECADQGWTGDARIERGILLANGDVDRAYLYLSLDDGLWQRVPENPDAFVEPVAGRLDFRSLLPADLLGHRVDLEAWGWKGASLLDLGTGHHEPGAAGSPPPNPVGGGGANVFAGGTLTSLDWLTTTLASDTNEFKSEDLLLREADLSVWSFSGGVKGDLTRTFRWSTTAEGVDRLLWQVASFPMPNGLAPDVPGVLLQQVVGLDEDTTGGEFPIDFRPLFAPPAQSASIGDAMSGNLIAQLGIPQPGAGVPATPETGAPAPTTAPAGGGTVEAALQPGESSAVYSPTWLLPLFTPSVLYIRAVPMDGAKVAGEVSNFVRFAVTGDDPSLFDPSGAGPTSPQQSPPAKPKPYQLYLQLLPPANANPAFSECVMVTGFQEGVTPGAWGLQPGDFFCKVYSSTSGWSAASAFEDFVGMVADAWDAVAGAWTWIQAEFAKTLATISGCSAIAGGEFCQKLAQVAISTALVAAGIPPSLPNTEDLIAMGKGELKDALVGLASAAVVSLTNIDPCDAAELAKQGLGTDSCDDIADQLVEDLLAQLDQLKTDEAAATSGLTVPYGVNVVVHPWGMLRPPRFRVTVARNVAVTLPATGECRMTLSMGSTVPAWPHKAWNETTKSWGTVTETVSGAPFLALTVAVPDPATATTPVFELPSALSPDASIYEIMLAALNKQLVTAHDYYLTEVAFWREPGNATQLYIPGKGYVSQVDQSNRAWVLLKNGSAVKGAISGAPGSPDCFDTVVVEGAIPSVDMGYPCTPAYGFYWETVQEPFTGNAGIQAACSLMYSQATGY